MTRNTDELIKKEITPSTPKQWNETQVLDGMASKSKVHDAKNATVEYQTDGSVSGKGPFGGKKRS